MPEPVPIVSPVVPLFSTPLLTPLPTPGRLGVVAVPPFWPGLAGEAAASPVVVVEPVLAFWAKAGKPIATEPAARSATIRDDMVLSERLFEETNS